MVTSEQNSILEEMPKDYVFAMDIGTRSIIGIVGRVEQEKLHVIAMEREEHTQRAMIDGQIEDIEQVAKVAGIVKTRLEDKVKVHLDKVYVAAAGRALKTQQSVFEMELESVMEISEEILRQLETGALAMAEEAFEQGEEEDQDRRFYLVGYSARQYYLDRYPISNLLGHKGKSITADVIATFLPSEVVESLYSAMKRGGMDVAGMTLEPIASMNASIPANLRLLNLALVDIGAGTSDIAVARDGSISGYTMATVAGDEVTECLMKEYLVDFSTAEQLKVGAGGEEDLIYRDVLGLENILTPQEVEQAIAPTVQNLCRRISEKIIEVNGASPSAVFLAGGGSKLKGIREQIAQCLEMDLNRVALSGNNFSMYACSEEYDIKDPEYSTPLGIAVSAGLNLINDSFYIRLNDERAKLFRSGKLTVRDILMMNGYGYKHMISRSGQNLIVEVDGRRRVVYGDVSTPAVLEVNGQPAKISDLVKAGDEITFIPAENGKDASTTLGDIVSLRREGSVFWNELELPLGVTATVNGLEAGADRVLYNGDKIKTCTLETVEDLKMHCEVTEIVYLDGQPVMDDRILQPGDEFSDGQDIVPATPLTVQVNGKNVSLPQKTGDVPYYLMDMLIYTDVDYTKPEGFVILRVNGVDAEYKTELKSGDQVEISWSQR